MSNVYGRLEDITVKNNHFFKLLRQDCTNCKLEDHRARCGMPIRTDHWHWSRLHKYGNFKVFTGADCAIANRSTSTALLGGSSRASDSTFLKAAAVYFSYR